MNRQHLLCLAAIALAMLSVCTADNGRKLLQPGGCNNPGCVCEGKPDGNYPLEFNVPGVAFVICKGGKSGPGKCAGGASFDKGKRACEGGAAAVEAEPEVPGQGQGNPQGGPGQDRMPEGVPGQGVPQGGPRKGYQGYEAAYQGYSRQGYQGYSRQGYEEAMESTFDEEEYNPTKSGFGDTGEFKGCLIKPQGRGVGTIPDGCGSGQFKSGLLCYPNCRDGYKAVGPVCWGTCAGDSTDIGAICSRPVKVVSANCNCPWYDKCGLTFSKGCCSCTSGFTRTGCTCNRGDTSYAKPSYGNGAGSPMTCTGGKVMDAGLCYNACPANTKGVGPMCWLNGDQAAPSGYPTKCDVGVSVNAYYADTTATCQAIASALNKVAISQGASGAACAIAIIGTLVPNPISITAAAVGCSVAISAAQLNNIPEYKKLSAMPACP